MGDLQQVKILVVDDEEFMRKLLTNILRKAGMEVLTAQNGEEALRVLQENQCDVVDFGCADGGDERFRLAEAGQGGINRTPLLSL